MTANGLVPGLAILLLALPAAAQQCMRNPVQQVVGGNSVTLAPNAPRIIYYDNAYPENAHILNLETGQTDLKTFGYALDGGVRPLVLLDGRNYLRAAVDLEAARQTAQVSALQLRRHEGQRFVALQEMDYQAKPPKPIAMNLIDKTDGRVAWQQRDGQQWQAEFSPGETAAVLYDSGNSYEKRDGRRDVRVIDLFQATEIGKFREDFIVLKAHVSADKRHVVTSNYEERKIRLRTLPDGKEIGRYEGHSYPFLRDGRMLFLAFQGQTGSLIVVDPAQPGQPMPFSKTGGETFQYELPGNRMVVTGRQGVQVVNLADMQPLLTFLPTGPYRFTPDGTRLLYLTQNAWRFIDVGSGRDLCGLPPDRGELAALSNSYVAFKMRETRNAEGRAQYHFDVFKLEDEGGARSLQQSQSQTAMATSAGLSAADRARAQGLFAQSFDLLKAGQADAAMIGFQRGLAIDPANPLGHYYMAEAYAQQNKTLLAKAHYQKVVDFAPDSREGLLAAAQLAKLP